MIDLRRDVAQIEGFLRKGINRFRLEYEPPKAIGIYSSPKYGWISLNFNIEQTIEEVDYNCPDFEYVEFEFFEQPDWESEYIKKTSRIIDYNGIEMRLDDFNDEEYQRPFFELFKVVVKNNIEEFKPTPILIQVLDSTMVLDVR